MAVVWQEGIDVAQPQAVVVGAVIPRQEETAKPGERRMIQQVPDTTVGRQKAAGAPACRLHGLACADGQGAQQQDRRALHLFAGVCLPARSSIHFRIRSATWRLFLSCMIMWLLPRRTARSGGANMSAWPPAILT